MKFSILIVALCAIAFADSSTDIAGGIDATEGQFPHVVAVRHSGTLICGGALIGLSWVLTSGECVWEYEGTEYAYSVYVGSTSILGSTAPNRVEHFVQAVYPHPNFKTKDTLYYSNIGLMHLSVPVTVNPYVGLAFIGDLNSVIAAGRVGELAGWGGTNALVSPKLQYATMTTMAITSCTSAVGGGVSFTAEQICTFANPGPSACWYDHGGPLIHRTNPIGTIILGVTAYAGCLDPTHPTIYTNPMFHMTWITSVTGILPVPGS